LTRKVFNQSQIL